MDTTTVLEIIKMIDAQLASYSYKLFAFNAPVEHSGAVQALSTLRDYLQSYIDEQLNALENQSPEC